MQEVNRSDVLKSTPHELLLQALGHSFCYVTLRSDICSIVVSPAVPLLAMSNTVVPQKLTQEDVQGAWMIMNPEGAAPCCWHERTTDIVQIQLTASSQQHEGHALSCHGRPAGMHGVPRPDALRLARLFFPDLSARDFRTILDNRNEVTQDLILEVLNAAPLEVNGV